MSPEDKYTEKELELLNLNKEAQNRAVQKLRSGSGEFMPATGVGVPSSNEKPNPPSPNMGRMVNEVAAAQTDLKNQAPNALSGDAAKIAGGVAGLTLLAYLAHKFMGGGNDGGGGGGGGNPPNNKRTSVRDRAIGKTEPTFNPTQGGELSLSAGEPTLAVVNEPAKNAPVNSPAVQKPVETVAKVNTPQFVATQPVDYSLNPSNAYGETKLNVPTGAPNVAVAPPAEVAPAPVQPMSHKERFEKAKADLAELKVEQAKNASSGSKTFNVDKLSNPETVLQMKSFENATANQVTANQKNIKSAKKTSETAVAPPKAIAEPIKGTEVGVASMLPPETPPATAPKTSNVKEISLPKEWPAKGMNWLTSQYGEEGARQFINQYNKGEPFKTHDDMKKVYDQVMTKPSFNTMPKDLRKSRGITVNPEYQQYKIVPNAIVPPSLPSGGGGGGMVVPRGGIGNLPGANEQIHALNPLKL
jgi:hypothetical protein